jgi:hypothetical protein
MYNRGENVHQTDTEVLMWAPVSLYDGEALRMMDELRVSTCTKKSDVKSHVTLTRVDNLASLSTNTHNGPA